MIPIVCPKCGRSGKAPDDRANARLVCKVCHTVFHLGAAGQMILGEPVSHEPKQPKEHAEIATIVEDFDLAKTWNDIPKPVRYGVPAVLVSVAIWLAVGTGESTPDYESRARAVIQALASNNRSRVVSYASSDSTEAAGKWFDLLHGELEKSQIGSDVPVSPTLLSGVPERDSEILLVVILSKVGSPPVSISLPMKRDGSYWMLDGIKCLAGAEITASTAKKSR